MKLGAEKERSKYNNMNEVDGPVFKIRNDPRFTLIGAFLCHSGLDELPQLFNVVLGDMSLVGPRPFPVYEANKIEAKFKTREKVRPGIISPWVLNGCHKMGFNNWMKSDCDYVNKKSLVYDLFLLRRGMGLLVKLVLGETFKVQIQPSREYKKIDC
jgi:lipopolysaccharide/colanic/teichoic acid biosynthesis glycosyltransferase